MHYRQKSKDLPLPATAALRNWQSRLKSVSKTSYQQIVRSILICVITIFLVWTLFSTILSLDHETQQLQFDFQPNTPQSSAQYGRQAKVKSEFRHAWFGYKDHAWMADSLMSLTGNRREQFCGWSATLVDSLDTLWIMNMTTEWDEAVEAVLSIDFTEVAKPGGSAIQVQQVPFPHLVHNPLPTQTRTCTVNLFESAIRYLGGMLAAYDLSGDERLKTRSIELGEMLHKAWNTRNGLPCSYCDPVQMASNETLEASEDVPLADVGSFYLELARLSQVSGDDKFWKTAKIMTDIFERTQNGSQIAGLWPERFNASAFQVNDTSLETNNHAYSLGALSDSTYEYLVKGHLMLGRVTEQYSKMWDLAATAIQNFMLFRAFIPDWETQNVLFSGIVSKQPEEPYADLEPRTQHLACFAGGMFAMSSRIFNRPSDFKVGEALTQGCVWAYDHSPIGIMPETFSLVNCPSQNITEQCEWNQTMWNQIRKSPYEIPEICEQQDCLSGTDFPDGYLSSIDTKYLLRPEAIESVFIMYRLSGDEKWRDIGWRMFENIIKHTRTPYGHSSLSTVMSLKPQRKFVAGKEVMVDAANQIDEMESFWLAETLKYFYLLFSETNLISLDEFVLNTEAHPLRLQKDSRGFRG